MLPRCVNKNNFLTKPIFSFSITNPACRPPIHITNTEAYYNAGPTINFNPESHVA